MRIERETETKTKCDHIWTHRLGWHGEHLRKCLKCRLIQEMINRETGEYNKGFLCEGLK